MIIAAGGMTLGRGKEVCAAISIDDKDFYAMFDHKERPWTARWKWTMNKAPDQLCNTIPEYAVSTKNRAAYEEELQMWTDNSWFTNADECTTKLREWCQKVGNVALLDLKRAYLQIRVYESLWPF